MAKKRRPSPTEADYQRIAEAIYNLDTFDKIKDYQSFEDAYEDYMGDKGEDAPKLKSLIFEEYLSKYDAVSDTRGQRKTKVQEVQTRTKKQLKKGELVESGIPSKIVGKKKRILNYAAMRKNKVVYAEKTSVNVKGKPQVRYRDSRGMFASVKKREVKKS